MPKNLERGHLGSFNVFYKPKTSTRRERLKSALYLRLKKRKTYFGKRLEIFELIFYRKSRTVPKKNRQGAL